MFRSIEALVFVGLTNIVVVVGCGTTTTYEIPIVPEARIWFVDARTREVVRCADLAPEGKPPEPVCVMAVTVDANKGPNASQ
jgi:hypothetical protein